MPAGVKQACCLAGMADNARAPFRGGAWTRGRIWRALRRGSSSIERIGTRRRVVLGNTGESRRGEHLRKSAKGFDQILRQGFDIAARDGAEENEFEQLVILDAVDAGLFEPRAQAFAMAGGVVGFAIWII